MFSPFFTSASIEIIDDKAFVFVSAEAGARRQLRSPNEMTGETT